MSEVEDQLSLIAWKVLFGEDYETIPDPNKPENIPYIKAKQKESVEKFKKFFGGSGKIMFEQWQTELRSGMFELLIVPLDCNCKVSMQLYKLQYLLKLIVKAQNLVSE